MELDTKKSFDRPNHFIHCFYHIGSLDLLSCLEKQNRWLLHIGLTQGGSSLHCITLNYYHFMHRVVYYSGAYQNRIWNSKMNKHEWNPDKRRSKSKLNNQQWFCQRPYTWKGAAPRQNNDNLTIILYSSIQMMQKIETVLNNTEATKHIITLNLKGNKMQIVSVWSHQESCKVIMSHTLQQCRCNFFWEVTVFKFSPSQLILLKCPCLKKSEVRALPPLIMSIFSPAHGQQQWFAHSLNITKLWQDCQV